MSVILPNTNGELVEIRPSKIIALGLNYLDHIKESQSVNVQNFTDEIPSEPMLFPKTPNVLIGPGDPQCLDICCRLNGEVVQQSNTKHMIFKIPQIIAFVSRNFTMEPGDIIITGTPSGVGPSKTETKLR